MYVVTLARKPLPSTVAEAALGPGTGVLAIDSCRIHSGPSQGGGTSGGNAFGQDAGWNKTNVYVQRIDRSMAAGRWPANLVLCGVAAVADLDEQSGVLTSGTGAVKRASSRDGHGNAGTAYGAESRPEGTPIVCYGDSGGASRFFTQLRGR